MSCNHNYHRHSCNSCNSCNDLSDNINKNLGSYFFNALMRVQLPAGHATLIESLQRAFSCGLPAGHPSLIDIIKSRL